MQGRPHIDSMKHIDSRLPLSIACVLSLVGCGRSHGEPAADAAVADTRRGAVPLDVGADDAATRDPRWEPTRSAIACTEHTATLIAGGDVLLVGRCSLDGVTVAALRYDPASRTAMALAPIEPRYSHAAVALPDGSALVIGGFAADGDETLATTERFDVATDGFGAGPMLHERRALAGALVSDGRVVVAGGRSLRDDIFSLLASVEAIDLGDEHVSYLSALRTPRERMLLRQRGEQILAIGGVDADRSSNLEHLGTGFLEALPTFCPSPAAAPGELQIVCSSVLDLSIGVREEATLASSHMQPAVARLPDGALLVLGSSPWTHAPPALPERVSMGVATRLPNPEHGYLWPTATLLGDGTVLVVGEEASELLVY
jgi:hypothetical protein